MSTLEIILYLITWVVILDVKSVEKNWSQYFLFLFIAFQSNNGTIIIYKIAWSDIKTKWPTAYCIITSEKIPYWHIPYFSFLTLLIWFLRVHDFPQWEGNIVLMNHYDVKEFSMLILRQIKLPYIKERYNRHGGKSVYISKLLEYPKSYFLYYYYELSFIFMNIKI